MALTLSFAEGDRFFVGHTPVKMVKIVDDLHFVLEVEGEAYDIVGDKGVEIVPDVIVQAGHSPQWEKMAQCVLTAPRSIRILREAIYWKENPRG